jgi:hypothetical protein
MLMIDSLIISSNMIQSHPVSELLSEIILIGLVYLDVVLHWQGLFDLDVSERERFGVLAESSSSSSAEDVLQPLFQVLLSEGRFHY